MIKWNLDKKDDLPVNSLFTQASIILDSKRKAGLPTWSSFSAFAP